MIHIVKEKLQDKEREKEKKKKKGEGKKKKKKPGGGGVGGGERLRLLKRLKKRMHEFAVWNFCLKIFAYKITFTDPGYKLPQLILFRPGRNE